MEIPNTGGVKLAKVWEHPRTGAIAAFAKFPKGWKIPRHFHSSNIQAAILKGSLTVTIDGKPETTTKAGGYFLEPAREIHATMSKDGATIFQVTDGPFDAVVVDEQGNPLPPPPPQK